MTFKSQFQKVNFMHPNWKHKFLILNFPFLNLREMQIKATTGYYLTAVSTKSTKNKCWRSPRQEGKRPTQLLRAAIKRATEEASKTKTRATIPSGNPTPRCTYGKNHLSKTHRHPNFYCKTIDNSQGTQASKLPIHTPMNTEGMLHPYNGLWLSH